VAYDAIGTHAGCEVAYDASQKLLGCPCHGALFDPCVRARSPQAPRPHLSAPFTSRSRQTAVSTHA